MKKARLKKALSLLLVFSMVVSLMPALSFGAWAANTTAIVNGTSYSMAQAWLVVISSGGTITLEDDYQANGCITVMEGKTMTVNLNGHMIDRGLSDTDSGSASNGCLFRVGKNATLIVNGGTDADHADTTVHKGVVGQGTWRPNDSGSVSYKGGVLTGGYSSGDGGCITTDYGATVTVNNVNIVGNVSSSDGGAVYIYGGAHFNMNGGAVDYNKALDCYGGGFYVDNNGGDGYLNVSSGSISHNVATGNYYGGGIYCESSIDHALYIHGTDTNGDKSVQINDNHAQFGGGIYVTNSKNSIISNAELKGNTAQVCDSSGSYDGGDHQDGGAIYVNVKYFTIAGCDIESNSAWHGGGVYVNAEFNTISDTSIKYNHATDSGGGVYYNQDSPTMSDCTVTNNTADNHACGIYVDDTVDTDPLNISGKMTIDNNNHGDGTKSNLYFESYTSFVTGGRLLTVGAISVGSDVGISLPGTPSGYNGYDHPFTNSGTNANPKYFFCDDTGYYVARQNDPTNSWYRYLYMAPGTRPETPVDNITAGTVTTTSEKSNGCSIIKGYFQYPSVLDSDYDYTCAYYYSDGFFAYEPTKYNIQLATMSMCLAMSAFGANAGGSTDYTNKFCHVTQLMADIGCDSTKTYVNNFFTQKPGTNSIGVAIGQKAITVNGESSVLVPVAIRGGGYESEWASNVTLGDESLGEAKGFASAADQVTTEVNDYITKYGLSDEIAAGKVKFWVVGYSRAGATANLTSKRLVDKYGASKNQVYGYCFEAPMGAVKGNNKEAYYCIHNLINKTDAVPRVGTKQMDFIRYGVDHYMPGNAAGGVQVNDDGESYDNTSYPKDYKNQDYMTLRSKMTKQLPLISPAIQFEDYFHSATMSYVSGTAHDAIGIGWSMINEDGSNTDTSGWLDDFILHLQQYSINSNNGSQKDYNTDETTSGYRNFWSSQTSGILQYAGTLPGQYQTTMSLQDAVAALVPLVFGCTPEDKAAMKSILGQSVARVGKSDFYWQVLNQIHKKGEANYNKWIGYFWDLFFEEPTGSDAAAGYSSLSPYLNGYYETLKKAWPTLAAVLLDFLSDDYGQTGSDDLGTLLYNMDTIAQAHYWEDNLAWLRASDGLYNGNTFSETTSYKLTPPTSVTAPTATINGNPLVAQYTGDQTLILAPEKAGAAIYYTITTTAKGSTTTSDIQLYQGGVPLTVKDNTGADSLTKYTVTAYAMQYGVKSGTVTFNVSIKNDRHTVKVTTGVSPTSTTSSPYKENSTVTINANTPADKVFDHWTVTDTVTLLTNGEVATFTMPASDVTATAYYKDRISKIAIGITAPTVGSALADKTTSISLNGASESTQLPIAWSAGTTAIGKAVYNTEYTATVVLTGDKFATDIATTGTVTVAGATDTTVSPNAADGSVTVTCKFTTGKAKATSIVQPAAVTVPYGTSAADVTAKLPTTVTILAGGEYRTASVSWADVPAPATTTKSLTGTITAPDGVDLDIYKTVTLTLNVGAQPVSATPTANLAPGNYSSVRSVTLSAASDATIYYTITTNGSATSSTQYNNQPIQIPEGTTTITAYAVETGKANSATVTFNYKVTIPKVTGIVAISPIKVDSGAEFSSISLPPQVTLNTETGNVTAKVTWAVPAGNITATTVIKGTVADIDNYNLNGFKDKAEVTVDVKAIAAAPTADITPGTYTAAQTVTLSAADGATIYYTTKGTDPTEDESHIYSGPHFYPRGYNHHH